MNIRPSSNMEIEIMRITRLAATAFFLIPLILLTACEQQAPTNQSNSSRISYATNEHDKEIGNYVIHINALTTDQLPVEVARGYNISRSKNRAMLNVSVREKQDDTEVSIAASINVVAKNLSSQQKNVSVREIKEENPNVIYYIGELPVSNEENITFELDVTPLGSTGPLLISYSQQFFTQ